MDLHFKIAGVVLIILAGAHAIFPRYFNWKEELQPLSLINRQMMQVHTLFIALAVFLIGLLMVTSAAELTGTPFGKTISLGLALFWTVRLLVQFFGYSPKLWRGKRLETSLHIVFSLFWVYLSSILWINCFS